MSEEGLTDVDAEEILSSLFSLSRDAQIAIAKILARRNGYQLVRPEEADVELARTIARRHGYQLKR